VDSKCKYLFSDLQHSLRSNTVKVILQVRAFPNSHINDIILVIKELPITIHSRVKPI